MFVMGGEMAQDLKAERCFKAGVWGSIIAAICCFTPVLVITLGVVGLAALTPFLDFFLLPLLVFFLVLTGYGWWKTRGQKESK